MKSLLILLLSIATLPAYAKNKKAKCKIIKEYDTDTLKRQSKLSRHQPSFNTTQIKLGSSTIVLNNGLNLKSEQHLGFLSSLNSQSITPYKNDIISYISASIKNNSALIKTKRKHLNLLQKSTKNIKFIAFPNWSKDSLGYLELTSEYLKRVRFVLTENLSTNRGGLSIKDIESYLILVSDPITYSLAFPAPNGKTTYDFKGKDVLHKKSFFKDSELKLLRSANFYSTDSFKNDIKIKKDPEAFRKSSELCNLQFVKGSSLASSLSSRAKLHFNQYLKEVEKSRQTDKAAKTRNTLKVLFDKSTTAQDQEEISQVGFNTELFATNCENKINNRSNFDYKTAQVIFNLRDQKGLFILSHKNRFKVLNEIQNFCKN